MIGWVLMMMVVEMCETVNGLSSPQRLRLHISLCSLDSIPIGGCETSAIVLQIAARCPMLGRITAIFTSKEALKFAQAQKIKYSKAPEQRHISYPSNFGISLALGRV